MVRIIIQSHLEMKAYWIPFFVFLGINAGACGPVCSHGLVSIFSVVEDIFFLIVMYTFHYFRANKGAFGHDSL